MTWFNWSGKWIQLLLYPSAVHDLEWLLWRLWFCSKGKDCHFSLFENVTSRCKITWPSVTLPLRSLSFSESNCYEVTEKISEVEPGLIFYQRSVYLSSLAMHVHLYYGLWRLSVGSDTCSKKTYISLVFLFYFKSVLLRLSSTWLEFSLSSQWWVLTTINLESVTLGELLPF